MVTQTQLSETPTAAAIALDPAEWVDRHGDYLFRYALGQVRNPTDAEDLVQETLLAAFNARERFSGASSERTWLTGILRHKIYDHLRRITRERPVTRADHDASEHATNESWDEALLWLHDVADECLHPNRRLELAEFRSALEAALGTLPPRIAQVFQLYEVEQRSGREVCEAVNISESNLWVMLHRARKQLGTKLGGWWKDGEDTRKAARN